MSPRTPPTPAGEGLEARVVCLSAVPVSESDDDSATNSEDDSDSESLETRLEEIKGGCNEFERRLLDAVVKPGRRKALPEGGKIGRQMALDRG